MLTVIKLFLHELLLAFFGFSLYSFGLFVQIKITFYDIHDDTYWLFYIQWCCAHHFDGNSKIRITTEEKTAQLISCVETIYCLAFAAAEVYVQRCECFFCGHAVKIMILFPWQCS